MPVSFDAPVSLTKDGTEKVCRALPIPIDLRAQSSRLAITQRDHGIEIPRSGESKLGLMTLETRAYSGFDISIQSSFVWEAGLYYWNAYS
ncbi:uncharacterized protein J3R85_001959 [Psidium guajava]|nr:uncharacterized protein J3R85_001959 [Psidium guajava]